MITLEQALKQRYNSTLSLISALDRAGGQGQASAALPTGKKPDTHITGGWGFPGAGLDW
jgi:hypothetical protein